MNKSIVFFVGSIGVSLGIAAPLKGQALADHPRVVEALDLVEIWVDVQRDYEDVPGISAAIVHDQDRIWSGGFGASDLSTGAEATPHTIYSICSISKLFTSMGVMQLRDGGSLRLDDPVEEHLPWFDIERRDPGAPPITVGALLTHSSGLPREAAFPYWSGPDFPFPERQEMISKVSEQETLYPADRYYQYSNLAFSLAGEVVSAVSGRPYEQYIREEILTPLGLDDTTPEIPVVHEGGRLATGYGRRMPGAKRETIPYYAVRGVAPAAGFASTVLDLGLFASWQFRALEESSAGPLTGNTLREMQRVHWVDPDWGAHRGIGFSVSRRGDETFVGHGGSCPGYRSDLLLQTDRQVATVVMANASGVNTGMYARGIYDIVAPALAEAVGEDGRAADNGSDHAVADVDRYLGLYRGFWGDAAVIRWKGGVAMVSLPTENPMSSLTELEPVGEDTFRRVRDDGELAEEVVFVVESDDRASRLVRNSNPMFRIR